MQVKDVMTKEVKWVEVPGTRAEALELLRKLGASAVPVVKQGTGELVGMVTLRKLFEHPDEDQLAMLVDRDVATVTPDDSLEEAAKRLLASHVRRLPVLKDGRLVGIITVRDIVYRAIAAMNIEKPASDHMRPHVIAVWDGTPLRAAMEIMTLSNFRALPVIDEKGSLVGIIDDSDIVNISDVETESKMSQMAGRTEGDSWTWDSEDRIYITKRKLKVPDKLVREVMAKELVTITKRTPVSRCAELMKQHKIEQTPVTSADGRLIGIVRDVDLLQALVS
ncbi:MAG: CBS domain-containing protein [Candidatus Hodarchaeaceae archaeon]|nr:CBS domain-containing protein [Candidatus Hodarchaeaceae archaeon]